MNKYKSYHWNLKVGSNEPHRVYTVGPLRVDLDGHYVFWKEKEIQVSPTEMRLLVYLISVGGRVCTRQELLDIVGGYAPESATRTLDAHMKRLRDKLRDAGPLFETVRGVGYRLSDAHPIQRSGPI